MNDHLLNWVPMLVSDMQQFARTDFYKGLGNLTLGFAQEDKDVLDELLASAEEDDAEAEHEPVPMSA